MNRHNSAPVWKLALATLLALGALVAAGTAVPSSGAAHQGAARGRCTRVGWIATVRAGVPHASLQPTGPSRSCACPVGPCARASQNQFLFANEAMYSGGGQITFKSAVKALPSITCIVGRRTRAVLFPSSMVLGSAQHALLQIVRGATSCQVGEGSWKPASTYAIFIVENAIIRVAIQGDPVFGVKVAAGRALIQVKKGTVEVGAATGRGSTAVGPERQIAVSSTGRAVGGVAPLASDPALRQQLCTLTPDLRLTNVVAASGAKPGGDPLGLAPDLDGNIWFTDDVTPALGVYSPTTGKIRYVDGTGLNPGSVPRFITTDGAGDVWFTDTGRIPAIGRIDPGTGTITEYRLPPGSVPWAPAYDPIDHLVWFTDQRKPTGAIGSIDPATNRIVEYGAGLRAGSHPEGIAVDAKGIVWFTDDNGPSPALGALDPATHAIHEYSTGLVPGSLPRGITIGDDGNVWFADERTVDNHTPHEPGDGLIGMTSTTDPTHEIVEYPVAANGGNVHSIPEGLAWYRGYVWFTDDGATKAIGRIDPKTGAITESSKALVADSKPIGILVSKGVLWFTDRLAGSPKIGRLVAKASC